MKMERNSQGETLSKGQLLSMQQLTSSILFNMPACDAQGILPESNMRSAFKRDFVQFLKNKSWLKTARDRNFKNIIAQIPILKKYFFDVFGVSVDLDEMMFPQHPRLKSIMISLPQHTENEVGEAIVKYASEKSKKPISFEKYKNPIAENLLRGITDRQWRPTGIYSFVHSGEWEPDIRYRGNIYNSVIMGGFPFINTKEYLYIQGFSFYMLGKFLDKKGLTITSDLWVNDDSVCGFWNENDGKLHVHSLERNVIVPSDDGPRELFLLPS